MSTLTTVRQIAARVQQPDEVRQRGSPDARGRTRPEAAPSFSEEFKAAQDRLQPHLFRVSVHAQERIEQRGISLGPTEERSIGEAFKRLEAKGARNALLLRPDAAFVVSVANKTVVTALANSEIQERVFTQIDSAMLLR